MAQRLERHGLATAVVVAHVLVGALVLGGAAVAQEAPHPAADQGVARLLTAVQAKGRLERSAVSGLARFVSAPDGIPASGMGSETTADGRARAFLRDFGAAFGLTASEMRTRRTLPRDATGTEHVRLQQVHRGLPVTGAELVVHLRGGLVTAVNGRTIDDEELSRVETAPRVTVEIAVASARAVAANGRFVDPVMTAPRLEILNKGLLEGRRTPSRLAWFVEARASRVRELVWIDATTGEVLLHFNQQPDTRQRAIYTAANGTALPGTWLRAEGQGSSGDADGDSAYRFAGDTYDYLWSRFGRDSIDGAGQPLVLTVHYGVNFANAFWDTTLEQMAFGDGAGSADDVVAHEITHGLTQHTADLYYYKQSGALNEAVSDILGETVDLVNGAGNDGPAARWLVSEDWAGVGPLRNMMDPTAMGSPGKLSDSQLQCGEVDNGGVHTNSGVLNHAFALAVDGGTYNGRTISGVGLEKAAAVVYRALTAYMTTSSDFADADSSIRQSCADLARAGSLGSADCAIVGSALDAVELSSPWPCAEPSVAVSKQGNDTGVVTSSPLGIDCGDSCEAPFSNGSHVFLSAAPDPGAVFAGWGGACSGVGECSLVVEGRTSVTATFDAAGTMHPVTVSTIGTGAVTSSPPGIDCGAQCTSAFPSGSSVTLMAVTPPGWALAAWGGDCSGRGVCTLTMDGPKTVSAAFAEAPFAPAASLGGVYMGQAAWGDYDGDGDLDLIVVGRTGVGSSTTLYRNDGGNLVDVHVSLVQVNDFAAWGDYDNDGDLDLVVGGWTGVAPWRATKLYRNDAGTFVPVATPFVGLDMGATAAWGDYDNDGDLDLVMAGYDGSVIVTKLYRNDRGAFVDTGMPLVGAYYGSLAWADYDLDGDLDLVVAGDGQPVVLYRNDAGVFVDSGAGLPRADSGSVSWADYDGDGDPDLALAGASTNGLITRIYRNDAGFLTDSGITLPGIYYGSATWGDVDGDGDPDLLVMGTTYDGGQYRQITRLYRNDGGTFTETFSGLPELGSSAVAWGDYDNNGRTDLLLLGYITSGGNETGIYRNLAGAENVPPSPPSPVGATALAEPGGVRLEWSPAADAETPAAALSYNLQVGTVPDGAQRVSPMADPASGFRRLVAHGNAGQRTSFDLHRLPQGQYYWSVQAIDASHAGSPFGATRSFAVSGGGGEATLTVGKLGGGSGVVSSVPGGIQCGSTCSASFPLSTAVQLTATPDPGSSLAGWAGACGGTGPCVVTVGGPTQVTATFERVYYGVSVSVSGQGSVTSSPAGISCGNDCDESFASGTVVTLTATPGPGAAFAGWTGACAGGGSTCAFAVDGPKAVGAVFDTPEFVVAASLTGVDTGDAAWGDYDGDGRLDLAVVGMTQTGAASLTRLYHNSGGQLADSGIALLNVEGVARWADYDNDGDLDLLVGGWSPSPVKGYFLQLYRNDSGTFVPVSAGLPTSVTAPDAAWGDYDNDGDLDLAVAGSEVGGGWRARVYRNDHGTFVDSSAIPVTPGKSVAWGDFDADGDLDLLVAGDYRTTYVYRNDGGAFVDIGAGLMAVDYGAAAWVDINGDGDLDAVVSGLPWGGTLTTRIYEYDGASFEDVGSPFAADYRPPAWADYDNDGDLDALVCATDGTRLYRNDGGIYVAAFTGLPRVTNGRCVWGDYDNDGRLDIVVSGFSNARITQVYRSTTATANTPPETPAAPTASVTRDTVQLEWGPASDAETPGSALTYNVRLGTTPNGSEVVSAMADGASGFRRVVAAGNTGSLSTLTIGALPPGQYYFAVQTVDAASTGSPFTATSSFVVESQQLLSVSRQGAGAGVITSAPAGIACGPTCDASFPTGTVVTLGAVAEPGSVFLGWAGACSGTGACTVTVDGPTQVTATFERVYYGVSVSVSGQGSVTSSPAGISCGNDCDESFASGTVVTLTATPGPGATFAGWTGACAGVGSCAFAVDGPKTVGAVFDTQAFVVAASLTGVDNGGAAWGDYDGDGRLDLAVVGMTQLGAATLTRLYHNSGGQLADSGIALLNVDGVARWGDYDNDGDLDLVVGGWSASPVQGDFLQLYRNDSGSFVPLSVGLPPGFGALDAAWGDYDGDGDLDLAVAGAEAGGWRARVYRNDDGTFVDSSAIPPTPGKSVSWGDYDRDGDLDLLVGGDYQMTHVYRNDGGVFTDLGADLMAVDYGAAQWVDFDDDGYLDVVVSGLPWDGTLTTRLYRNDGSGSFVDAGSPFAADYKPPSWADYDNDGDLDALVCANDGTLLYRNDGGAFVEETSELPPVWSGRCGWGDYDGDGRLDVVISGFSPASGDRFAQVYRSLTHVANTPPETPAAPTASVVGDSVRLEWSPASDAETPGAALTYNVRLGTTPNGSEVVSAMADGASGFRRVVGAGNTGSLSTLTVGALPPGQYYFAVQTVDAAFTGSPFTATSPFVVESPQLLSVSRQGAGAGVITSAPAGIACGPTCDASFPTGSVVTLSAVAEPGSVFSGWAGACSGTGACTVTMDTHRAIAATFDDTVHVDLALSLTNGQTSVLAGRAVTYTLRASNSGPNAARGATVSETFPPTVKNVKWACSATGGARCAPSGTGPVHAVVDLPVGGSVVFTTTGLVSAGASGNLVVSAGVTAPYPLIDSDPSNNATTDEDAVVALEVSIGDTSVIEGNKGTKDVHARRPPVACGGGKGRRRLRDRQRHRDRAARLSCSIRQADVLSGRARPDRHGRRGRRRQARTGRVVRRQAQRQQRDHHETDRGRDGRQRRSVPPLAGC